MNIEKLLDIKKFLQTFQETDPIKIVNWTRSELITQQGKTRSKLRQF